MRLPRRTKVGGAVALVSLLCAVPPGALGVPSPSEGSGLGLIRRAEAAAAQPRSPLSWPCDSVVQTITAYRDGIEVFLRDISDQMDLFAYQSFSSVWICVF